MKFPTPIWLSGIMLTLLLCANTAATLAATAPAKSPIRSSVLIPEPVAPSFSKIGPVAKNLWPFNALNVYDKKLKTDVFYITSFNSAGFGQLIRLDYHHDNAKAWTFPAGIGSWGIIEGKDGNLYMGSYNEGKLLCFDPRTEKWISLPQASEAFRKIESIICALAQAPNGDIYFGTYPNAHLVRYDPRAGTVTDLGRAADENYLRHIAITPDGIVLCGVGTRRSRILAYDPKTRKFSELAPEKYQSSGVLTRPLVNNQYIVQQAVGQILVYDSHTLQLLHVLPLQNATGLNLIDANHLLYRTSKGLKTMDLRNGATKVYYDFPGNVLQGAWYMAPHGNLLGLRVQSYVYIDVKNQSAKYHPIPVDGLGQDVFWLRSTPSGEIYGGPGLGQTMFSYHPGVHELKSYDQVIDAGGEIYYGIPHGGKIYTISYIEATLAVFDPSRAWDQGNDPDSNPRTILHIPQNQYRPVGGIHEGPGGKLYIGTQPDYGLVGGALSVFDPVSEKLEVYRNIIPNEEIGAIATDERYVYCASDRGGGGGSKPIASGAHFFVWDPDTHKIVFDHTFPDDSGIGAIAAVNGHAYFVARDKLMDYNRATSTLTSIYTFDKVRGVPNQSLQVAKDGTLWGILGRELAHIDPSSRKVEFFPETAGHATSGLTIGADGTIYFGSHTDVWIYHPKSPSPPLSFGQ
ncbi:MAG: hypothetical protein ABI164_07445 [Acidobacteriaceae bacterium]